MIRGSAIAAAAGAVGLAIGLTLAPGEALVSYLIAYAYVASIALGLLIFVMTVHAMNAVWSVATRRLCELGFDAFPLLLLLFIPIALGAGKLYPWLHPETLSEEVRKLVAHKRTYLNLPFFLVRSFFYLACWALLSVVLKRWSFSQTRDAEGLRVRARILSSGALPLVGFTLSFAAVDWLMSREPDWFSTMYGIYYFAGGFLGGLSLLTLLAHEVSRRRLVALSGSHFYALGRLLLAFVIFWAYIAFFQLMLIWIADKPVESKYYVTRTLGMWRWSSASLFVLHFLVPFFALLPYRLKRRSGYLAAVALLLLIMHFVDVSWLVAPPTRHGFPIHLFDLAALAFVGGSTVLWCALRARGVELTARGDLRLQKALEYHSI